MGNINLTDIEEKLEGSPFLHFARLDNLFISSQLESNLQIEYLKSLDISFAIDMKEKGESDFPEEELLTKAGIKYYHFPVSDIEDVSFDQLCTLTKLLAGSNSKKLIYCMSGNRVASLLAMQQSLICGHPKKRALSLALKLGVTKDGLKKRLEKVLNL